LGFHLKGFLLTSLFDNAEVVTVVRFGFGIWLNVCSAH